MRHNQRGFGLIALIITIAIMAILVSLYYKQSPGGEKSSPAEVGKKAIEDTKTNNQNLIEQNLEIQNELNSIQ